MHFWRKESGKPGQTLSYYLDSCKFCLLDYRRRGRSLDSPTRSHLRAALPEESDTEESFPAELVSRETSSDLAGERDLLQVLAQHLDEMNRRILLLAANRAGVREISRELHLSHPAVVKRLRIIRATARSLGFHP